MHRLWFIILFLVAALAVDLNAVPSTLFKSHLGQAIDSIDIYLDVREHYLRNKKSVIEDIKGRLGHAGTADSTSLLIDLAKAYRRYDVDSAALYYGKAIKHAANAGAHDKSRQAAMKLCAVNTLRGIVKESVEQFESIDPSALSQDELPVYYDAGFDVYLSTASFYPDGELGQSYIDKAVAMSDSLAACLSPADPHCMYHRGWSALKRGDMPVALVEMRSALDATSFGDELYARIAANLADYYMQSGDDTAATAYYLALSAMSDIVAGTRETTSLQRLGLELYRRGDVSRAYRYLNVALDNSVSSGSKIRTLTEVDALPIISKAYNDKDEVRIKWLYLLLAVLSVAIAALVSVLLSNRRSHKRLLEYKHRLAESNVMKDEYIKQIMSLCSSCIERIEDLNRMIIRKLKAGQTHDLLRMIESGEMLRDQGEKFLKSFDESFLKIYPDFIESLNGLLNPKDRFPLTSDKKLNPELRIAAFMRLGVDDSQRIARFLGLSLNTVYTYRNKLKNRAAKRDDFERRVKNIGGVY